jgi:hypothetical protein
MLIFVDYLSVKNGMGAATTICSRYDLVHRGVERVYGARQ